MTTWTHQDFCERGESIARAFCAGVAVGGESLPALVEKVARDATLNAEQIRRLARATNVAMFNTKYAEKRQDADRRVDFDPVDENAVIARLQACTPLSETTKTAAVSEVAYPDLWRTPATKVAAESSVATPHPKELELRRSHLRKLAHDLPTEVAQLGVQWDLKLASIADRCCATRHDHLAFEKAAVAIYGADILPEIQSLRTRLGLAPMAATSEKLAEVRNFLIANPTRLTDELGEVYRIRTAYHQKAAMLRAVRDLHTQARELSCG